MKEDTTIKELILKYLNENYYCAWGGVVKTIEGDHITSLAKLLNTVKSTFACSSRDTESYVFFYLVDCTRDVPSIMTYWTNGISNAGALPTKINPLTGMYEYQDIDKDNVEYWESSSLSGVGTYHAQQQHTSSGYGSLGSTVIGGGHSSTHAAAANYEAHY